MPDEENDTISVRIPRALWDEVSKLADAQDQIKIKVLARLVEEALAARKLETRS